MFRKCLRNQEYFDKIKDMYHNFDDKYQNNFNKELISEVWWKVQ